MARLPIPYGDFINDPNPANSVPIRTAWQRADDNFMDLYSSRSQIISAGDVRFAGEATTEAKITAAVAQAVIELATIVFIPANMLAYDPSLVTFDDSVRMVREGGDFSLYDVLAYGANRDGVVNTQLAIKEAMDAASANGGGVVFAPQGTYRFIELRIPANVTLRGAGRGVTVFRRYDYGIAGTVPTTLLFSIGLAGSFSALRDCTVRGRWNPADPTTQTYDFAVAVYGDGVEHCVIENVEAYDAHEGFNVGGILQEAPTYSFAAQNYNRIINCYAHDTYDLGFGLIAAGRGATDTCIGNQLIGCVQHDSYATAGLELRYQIAPQVIGFNSRNNANASLGAGIRLEEVDHAVLTNIQVADSAIGIQVINDTYDCTISSLAVQECTDGVYVRASSDITLADVDIDQCRYGVRLAYSDGTSWTRNNERVHIDGGVIRRSGTGGFGYGVYVVGTGFTEASLANNGKGLTVRNVHVSSTGGVGIFIEAGGNFSILGCTLEDNYGTGSDGTGIVINSPDPNGVEDLTKPANGYITDCTFITTSSLQDTTISDATGAAGARLTSIGTIHNIGGGTLPTQPHRSTSTSAGDVTNRGLALTTTNQSGTYAALQADYFIRMNASGGASTVNLPAVANNTGRVYVIQKTDTSTNTVTIDGNASETINNATTYVLRSEFAWVEIWTTGSNWNVKSRSAAMMMVDGWLQDNVAASQTNVELTRGNGRFRAVRAGAVTGVVVTSTEARTAGTLTVTVFKNTGLAGAAGSTIGLTAVLDGTNTSRKATTQNQNQDAYAAGDELYAVVTTDGSWLPTTADIRVAIEIET